MTTMNDTEGTLCTSEDTQTRARIGGQGHNYTMKLQGPHGIAALSAASPNHLLQNSLPVPGSHNPSQPTPYAHSAIRLVEFSLLIGQPACCP